MTTNPTSLGGQDSSPSSSPIPRREHTALLVAEDWLLAAWVGLATPYLFRVQSGAGPFDGGAPLPGLIRIAAVFGALICLAAKRAPNADASGGRRWCSGAPSDHSSVGSSWLRSAE